MDMGSGMDPRLPITREDLYTLQMEMKQVQYGQTNHADRILRLEKKQADDVALRSVWNSPFPGVLSATPQQGPVQTPQDDVFRDLDEQGEELLGSLHLGPTEEEPARRGAASRANSVRFDESALHGAGWAGHHRNNSGEFVPVRPGSSLMMERSLSHKSDGRHSSAGHSVHSHHSVPSGRASSVGLDTNYAADDDDDASFDIPGPPASFYVLGSVPAIVRCWLTTNFAHSTLLYADVCTGAQRSTIDFSLLHDLDLVDEIQRDADGIHRIRLCVYFAEAVIIQHSSRSVTFEGDVPRMTVFFEVLGVDQPPVLTGEQGLVRIFVGSDALRAHSADILFSQNTMMAFSDERHRLRVPFVRPENDAVFRNISTSHVLQEKPKLNANATPFVFSEPGKQEDKMESPTGSPVLVVEQESPQDSPLLQPDISLESHVEKSGASSNTSERGGDTGRSSGKDGGESETGGKGGSSTSEVSRRGSSTGIWGSWRQGTAGAPESSYQPAPRPGRGMKVLKPPKPSSSSARTGASYEPPLPSRSGGEARRKSHGTSGPRERSGTRTESRWDTKRSASSHSEASRQRSGTRESVPSTNANTTTNHSNSNTGGSASTGPSIKAAGPLPRSGNPVGVASAFSWMAPSVGKGKPPATTTE